jgi:hypothetical protein
MPIALIPVMVVTTPDDPTSLAAVSGALCLLFS